MKEQLLDLKKIINIYPWLVLFLIISFIAIYSIFQIFYPIYLPEPGKTIYISPGTSIKDISNKLEQEKIIRSAFFLRIYLYLLNKATNIKAGFYTFQGDLNIKKATEILINGGRGIVITFPEGLTLVEINDLLNKNGLKVDLKKYKLSDFNNIELLKYFPADVNLEGFLMPDTYEFFYEESEIKIVEKFLKNFSKKALPLFLKYPEYNFYEKLIKASILEKEVKTYEEMRIVSGIIDNRLANKMKLEIDATLAYLNCQSYPCSWQVTAKDLKTISSPYNTYQNYGYPPTPINNPGLNAIKAALEPLKNKYFYYLTDKEGRAIFSTNLKEHQSNIKKYLK